MEQKNKTFFVKLMVGAYVVAEDEVLARSIAKEAFWKIGGFDLDLESVSVDKCEECGGED
jgi:hypothetical protein